MTSSKSSNHYDTPLVSVIVLTYNHEHFIRQCLDGIVMQKTDFPFEIIVHDDASTDGTAIIISEYANKYSFIKPIIQTENQFSKNDMSIFRFTVEVAKGKYIALCEGDDYWIDSCKLQRQWETLYNNTEYSMLAENCILLDTINNRQYPFSEKPSRDISMQELIEMRPFQTSTVMIRKHFIDDDFYKLTPPYDTLLWCYFASKGKIKYNDNISSIYRKGIQGITVSMRALDWCNNMTLLNKSIVELFGDYVSHDTLKQRTKDVYLHSMVQLIEKKIYNKDTFIIFANSLRLSPYRTVKLFLIYLFLSIFTQKN